MHAPCFLSEVSVPSLEELNMQDQTIIILLLFSYRIIAQLSILYMCSFSSHYSCIPNIIVNQCPVMYVQVYSSKCSHDSVFDLVSSRQPTKPENNFILMIVAKGKSVALSI